MIALILFLVIGWPLSIIILNAYDDGGLGETALILGVVLLVACIVISVFLFCGLVMFLMSKGI